MIQEKFGIIAGKTHTLMGEYHSQNCHGGSSWLSLDTQPIMYEMVHKVNTFLILNKDYWLCACNVQSSCIYHFIFFIILYLSIF